MSKNTIFGEEHFIDTQMIKLVEQRNNAIDNYVFEQMENAIKGTLFVEMPKVEINKEKLKKWVVLCSKLENIEHSELVDMATKKRIADLEEKLAEKEKEIDKLEDKLHHYYEETLNNGTCGLCEHLRGEYKTDFAIAQLEKVKTQCEFSITFASDEQEQRLYAFIDQQIKELKEGK